jgi:hypothetical protein
MPSIDYLYASPEGYVVLDLIGGLFWLWVIPGPALVDLSINFDIIIIGYAFPRASRVCITFLEVLAHDGIWRKVVVAFHHDGLVAFYQYCSISDCFWHDDLLCFERHYTSTTLALIPTFEYSPSFRPDMYQEELLDAAYQRI